MLSPAEYREYAENARKMGIEYRIEAVTADEPRKSMLLKWADQREEHADFYDSRADMAEDYEARRAARLIESAREAIMQKDAA